MCLDQLSRKVWYLPVAGLQYLLHDGSALLSDIAKYFNVKEDSIISALSPGMGGKQRVAIYEIGLGDQRKRQISPHLVIGPFQRFLSFHTPSSFTKQTKASKFSNLVSFQPWVDVVGSALALEFMEDIEIKQIVWSPFEARNWFMQLRMAGNFLKIDSQDLCLGKESGTLMKLERNKAVYWADFLHQLVSLHSSFTIFDC